jgi:hypothetical protein
VLQPPEKMHIGCSLSSASSLRFACPFWISA